MYNVSEIFKNAIKSTSRTSTITGTLITVDGAEYALNDSTFIKDSLYITNQIVNNNKLTFGAVYAGECGMVINSDIDRYSLFGARIVLNFTLDDETLPLGVFYVDTPERIGSKIKLTAVDCMSNFDKTVSEDVNGTWYEMLSYTAGRCGVELAQSQEVLEALHENTIHNYTIRQEHIATYRDALSYLCMVICANATIDNTGRLKIVTYATEPCDSNDRTSRLNGCKFSDYTTRYRGIKMRFLSDENYYPYSYYYPEPKGGLTLDCGDIPIVGGTNIVKHQIANAMCETLTTIEYVPATLYVASNPAYELGDKLECRDVNNSNDTVYTYIMAYSYDYRKKETIASYGDNPLLQNVKSKEEKKSSSMESQIASKDVVVVNATNASTLTIKQALVDVATINFSVNTDCKPIILCTIPFSMSIDGYVEFSLYNGLIPFSDAVYKGYYEKGEHFATFMYLDNALQNERRSIRIMARCFADLTSDTRTQRASIRTLENKFNSISNAPAGDIFPQDKSMWEQGSIASADGADIVSDTRIRSYFVPITGGQQYKFIADASHKLVTRIYGADKAFRIATPSSFAGADFVFTTSDTDKYIRFVLSKSDNTVITADDMDNVCWRCEPVLDFAVIPVDNTEPAMTIAELAVKAIAYTQGINAGGGDWDGTIEFTDEFDFVELESIGVIALSDNVVLEQQIPVPSTFKQAFDRVVLEQVGVAGFTDTLDVADVVLNYIFDTSKADVYEYDDKYVEAVDVYKLKTEYEYTLKEESIDRGCMSVIEIDATEYADIESVVVTDG